MAVELKQIKIGILGTPVSSGNRGVMALGASLVKLCAQLTPSSGLCLLLGHHRPERVQFRLGSEILEVPVVNCRLSPKSRLQEHLGWIVLASILYHVLPFRVLRRVLRGLTPWIASLEDADLVGDVRGGDSFSDIYGMGGFFYGFLMAWTVILVKGSIVQFPQTYGPYRSPVTRMLARYLLKRSSVVIARDEKSQQIAQELGGPDREVCLCPDVAFSLESIPPPSIEVDPPLNGHFPAGVVGLNVNGLMYNGGYTRANMFGLKLDYRDMLPSLVKALLEDHHGELWLVPHTYGPPESVESDPEANRRVRAAIPESLQSRVRILTGEYDCHEIKNIIEQFDFFIGSRMHACIAALSQGVPCVGIAYSRKFQGVFESVGMGDWVVDGRDATSKQTVDRVLELYRQRDNMRRELEVNADQARRRLHAVFARLFNEIHQVCKS